jgi:hypothetical protein
MDRRLVQADDPILGGDRLFQQIRGGVWYLGSIPTAMEVNKPNSFIGLKMSTVDFARGMAFVLQTAGVLMTKHGDMSIPDPKKKCGAIKGAETIRQGVANGLNDPVMHANALQFKPDISNEMYERVVNAEQRIAAAGLTATPYTIDATLTTPASVLWTPGSELVTPHVDLEEDTGHDTIKFGADYRKGVAFDRALAYEQSRFGAYYSSLGALEEILKHFPDAVRDAVGNVETLWNVEALYLGRISAHDIVHQNPDGTYTPYPIEIICR